MRLLLADDELELTRAIATILEYHGYEVDVVYNGIEALSRINSNDYDTIILDIMMPGMDGITVLKQIRDRGIQIPVILLTAKSQLENRMEGFRNGADDYLSKPFATNELIARIGVLTRHYQQVKQLKVLQARMADEQFMIAECTCGNSDPAPAEHLSKEISRITVQGSQKEKQIAQSEKERGDGCLFCCGLKLDTKACTAIYGGKEVRLTYKEYQLLELFLNNPRQVFSTDYLLEHIWGYDTDSDNNVVWTGISRLRKLIYELGSDVKIKTSRGLGYYLEGSANE